MAGLMRVLHALQDYVWPQKVICLLCEERSWGEWLCPACRQRLKLLRIREQHGDVCSAYIYKGAARELVHALKYDALRPAATVLSAAMAEVAQTMALPPDTVLTWVTTPRARRWQRGGDHGRDLCGAVAERLELPTRQLLVRIRHARTQRGLNARERQTNLNGVFRCCEQLSGPVLMIDDVHTTGATLRCCAEALKAAGATEVYCLTATKVEGEDNPDGKPLKAAKGG